jgi:ketosteroid isomerase-like protein
MEVTRGCRLIQPAALRQCRIWGPADRRMGTYADPAVVQSQCRPHALKQGTACAEAHAAAGFVQSIARGRGKLCLLSTSAGDHAMRPFLAASTLMLMACALFVGCTKQEEQLPKAVMTEVTRDFNQGDAARTAAHYADDAEILPPRHPSIAGRPAITAFFQANIDRYISFGTDTQWSVVRGDLGIEQGVYNVRNVRVGEDVESGKYIRIWKRIDGNWKLYRDMFSPDSTLSEAVSISPDEPSATDNPPATASSRPTSSRPK